MELRTMLYDHLNAQEGIEVTPPPRGVVHNLEMRTAHSIEELRKRIDPFMSSQGFKSLEPVNNNALGYENGQGIRLNIPLTKFAKPLQESQEHVPGYYFSVVSF